MESAYDWCAQHLTAAPLALQLLVLGVLAIPCCAVAAVLLIRVIDVAALGWRRRGREKGAAQPHGQS